MIQRTVMVALMVTLLSLPAAVRSQHVNNSVMVPYGGDVERFCRLGYPSHGWVAVNGRIGKWKVISKYPNLLYVPSFVQRCRSGGMYPSTLP